MTEFEVYVFTARMGCEDSYDRAVSLALDLSARYAPFTVSIDHDGRTVSTLRSAEEVRV